jgi:hypothetical protein
MMIPAETAKARVLRRRVRLASRALDPMLAHAGAQRAQVDAGDLGGTAVAFNFPTQAFERRHDAVMLELRQGPLAGWAG